jgi:hypothetical protein
MVGSDLVVFVEQKELEADGGGGISACLNHLPFDLDRTMVLDWIGGSAEVVAAVGDVPLIRSSDSVVDRLVADGFDVLAEVRSVRCPKGPDGLPSDPWVGLVPELHVGFDERLTFGSHVTFSDIAWTLLIRSLNRSSVASGERSDAHDEIGDTGRRVGAQCLGDLLDGSVDYCLDRAHDRGRP